MITSLNQYGFLKISGLKATEFLQGQITCNVASLTNQMLMGAHCNAKGRVVSLFHIFKYQEAYYLFMLQSMIPVALTELNKYALFFRDTVIIDIGEKIYLYGLDTKAQSSVSLDSAHLTFDYGPKRQLMISFLPLPHLVSQNNYAHWKLLNLNQHIIDIYPETSGKFLPHELNLHQCHAIDFNKGCYTGQEIIARMHYKGKIKSHLYKATVTSTDPIKPGDTICADINNKRDEVGTIVDMCSTSIPSHYKLIVLLYENELDKPLHIKGNPTNYLTIHQ